MKILVVSDFHGNSSYYNWLIKYGSLFGAVVVAGDLVDMFRSETIVLGQKKEAERALSILEDRGVKSLPAQEITTRK